MKRHEAFTLTELLVLAAILAGVAALLLPALGGAHEISSRAACANNLRQIGLAMLAYSEEYGGNFPTCYDAEARFSGSNCGSCAGVVGAKGAVQFYQLLVNTKYLPSTKVFVCPSDKNCHYVNKDWVVTPAAVGATMQPWNKSYFFVSRLNSRRGSKPYLLMADDSHYMPDKCGQPAGPQNKVTPDVDGLDNHGAEGRNALFSDGHAQWINDPSINPYFQTAQQDYDAFGLHFETTD